MNFSFFVARRYFLSKRKKNFINIIALLSMVGVSFATAALIIVLSVFNGIGELLRSLYTSFDPPLKVEIRKGKSFVYSDSLKNKLSSVEGVDIVTEVIEDYVYVRNRVNNSEADMIVTMKGVSNNFIAQHRMDGHISSGSFTLYRNKMPCAVVGSGVRNTLSIAIENNIIPLQVFYVKNPKAGGLRATGIYSQKAILPVGVFEIEKNFDENYMFVPLEFARELLNYENRLTSLEIKTKQGYDDVTVQSKLNRVLGDQFRVLTNDEQHKDLYRLLKIEKLFTFLSLALLVMVASINIFFSLMMLVIDKKKDITILSALGATSALVKRIFISEAFIVSGSGTLAGLLIGGIFCFLQEKVGIIGMGMENSVVPNYPVKMVLNDFILIIVFNALVALGASWHPSRLASRITSNELL